MFKLIPKQVNLAKALKLFNIVDIKNCWPFVDYHLTRKLWNDVWSVDFQDWDEVYKEICDSLQNRCYHYVHFIYTVFWFSFPDEFLRLEKINIYYKNNHVNFKTVMDIYQQKKHVFKSCWINPNNYCNSELIEVSKKAFKLKHEKQKLNNVKIKNCSK